MALVKIKNALLQNVKDKCTSIELKQAMLVETEEGLIECGLHMVDWLYQSGVIDNDLLENEFTEAKLNSYNIYATSDHDISGVDGEHIYLLYKTKGTITVADKEEVWVSALGSAYSTITIGDNAYCKIYMHDDSFITIEASDNAVVDVVRRDKSSMRLIATGTSYINVESRGSGVVEMELLNNSNAIVNAYHHSTIVYKLKNFATITANSFHNAKITPAIENETI